MLYYSYDKRRVGKKTGAAWMKQSATFICIPMIARVSLTQHKVYTARLLKCSFLPLRPNFTADKANLYYNGRAHQNCSRILVK